jgi:imidazoleglycerol-phosphate dehydratase
MSHRKVSIERTTQHAEVRVTLAFGGQGSGSIQTGSPFLDHMLVLFARHAGLDLDVHCVAEGKDETVQLAEVATSLGLAIGQALASPAGSGCSGHAYAQVDENLARAVVETSGQPCLVFHGPASTPALGGSETAQVEAFWHACSQHARLNAGEAIFKAVARALKIAAREAAE